MKILVMNEIAKSGLAIARAAVQYSKEGWTPEERALFLGLAIQKATSIVRAVGSADSVPATARPVLRILELLGGPKGLALLRGTATQMDIEFVGSEIASAWAEIRVAQGVDVDENVRMKPTLSPRKSAGALHREPAPVIPVEDPEQLTWEKEIARLSALLEASAIAAPPPVKLVNLAARTPVVRPDRPSPRLPHPGTASRWTAKPPPPYASGSVAAPHKQIPSEPSAAGVPTAAGEPIAPAEPTQASEPVATETRADLSNHALAFCVMFHVEAPRLDGKDTWTPITLSSGALSETWALAVLSETDALHRLGIPTRIQVPAEMAVGLAQDKNWRSFVLAYRMSGGSIDIRSHKGGAQAVVAGWLALASVGVGVAAQDLSVVGSLTEAEIPTYLNALKAPEATSYAYALTGVGVPGHNATAEESLRRRVGFEELSPVVVRTHEGTANSIAKLVGLSRLRNERGLPRPVFAFVRGQAQTPVGSVGAVLWSPPRHTGTANAQAPVAFYDDLMRALTDIHTRATGATLDDMVASWIAAGRPLPDEIELSAR